MPLICFASQNRSGLHNALPALHCFSSRPPCVIQFCRAGQFLAHLPKTNVLRRSCSRIVHEAIFTARRKLTSRLLKRRTGIDGVWRTIWLAAYLFCFSKQDRTAQCLFALRTFLVVRLVRSSFVVPDNFLAHLPKTNVLRRAGSRIVHEAIFTARRKLTSWLLKRRPEYCWRLGNNMTCRLSVSLCKTGSDCTIPFCFTALF